MLDGRLRSLLQYCSSILRRPKRRSIDSGNSLTAIPLNQRYLRFLIGSKISGKSSNLELSVRLRSPRYFNLKMLAGRLRNLLQFFSSILRRPKRRSTDSDFWKVFKFRATREIKFLKRFQLTNACWDTQKPIAIFQFNFSETKETLD
ncbi:unnamed protein product [Malus baccata var. baccata]